MKKLLIFSLLFTLYISVVGHKVSAIGVEDPQNRGLCSYIKDVRFTLSTQITGARDRLSDISLSETIYRSGQNDNNAIYKLERKVDSTDFDRFDVTSSSFARIKIELDQNYLTSIQNSSPNYKFNIDWPGYGEETLKDRSVGTGNIIESKFEGSYSVVNQLLADGGWATNKTFNFTLSYQSGPNQVENKCYTQFKVKKIVPKLCSVELTGEAGTYEVGSQGNARLFSVRRDKTYTLKYASFDKENIVSEDETLISLNKTYAKILLNKDKNSPIKECTYSQGNPAYQIPSKECSVVDRDSFDLTIGDGKELPLVAEQKTVLDVFDANGPICPSVELKVGLNSVPSLSPKEKETPSPSKELSLEDREKENQQRSIELQISAPTALCESVPDEHKCGNSSLTCRDLCYQCSTKDSLAGIWTGIGCFPTNVTDLAKTVFNMFSGLLGLFIFYCIISNGLKVMISRDSADAMKKAQEAITSCIVGLLVLVFSVLFLRIVGVDILKLPGWS